MSLLTESKLPNIVIVMVANELRKENRVMNGTTTIVTEALRTVHNRIRMSTTAEATRLLEELRAAYQRLAREERQKIKSLMLTFSKSNGDSL
jgi:PHP family Zn ribbon phosphoesterase